MSVLLFLKTMIKSVKSYFEKVNNRKGSIALKYIIPIVSIIICIFKMFHLNTLLDTNSFYVIISSLLSTNVSIACTILTDNESRKKETDARYLIIIFSLATYMLIETNKFNTINVAGKVIITFFAIYLTAKTIEFTFKEIRQNDIGEKYIDKDMLKGFDEVSSKSIEKFDDKDINLEGKYNE